MVLVHAIDSQYITPLTALYCFKKSPSVPHPNIKQSYHHHHHHHPPNHINNNNHCNNQKCLVARNNNDNKYNNSHIKIQRSKQL